MTSWICCFSLNPTCKPFSLPATQLPPTATETETAAASSSKLHDRRCSLYSNTTPFVFLRFVGLTSRKSHVLKRRAAAVVSMAPDEEKLTRRNPLDFPIEWERPKPGRRSDIFPQFSPMKTPIPPPLPYDPPEEDEEEEEENEEKKEEEEEDPGKEEDPNKPDKQLSLLRLGRWKEVEKK